MELRRKNKPTPAEIQPPSDPEDWIARANADGAPAQIEAIREIPARHKDVKSSRKRLETKQNIERPSHINAQPPVQPKGARYISFAIDTITLKLFREMCFLLNKGNTATLTYIIATCTQMNYEEFQRFQESQVVSGYAKRTMSFLLANDTLENLDIISKRLHYRNKSALCRYLIQFNAHLAGIEFPIQR